MPIPASTCPAPVSTTANILNSLPGHACLGKSEYPPRAAALSCESSPAATERHTSSSDGYQRLLLILSSSGCRSPLALACRMERARIRTQWPFMAALQGSLPSSNGSLQRSQSPECLGTERLPLRTPPPPEASPFPSAPPFPGQLEGLLSLRQLLALRQRQLFLNALQPVASWRFLSLSFSIIRA
jgi:hypothetical protein